MRKLTLIFLSLFLFATLTPQFVFADQVILSNPRIVNGNTDFRIDLQISGAPDNICSWWTSLHHVYIVDLNGHRLQDFAGCSLIGSNSDGSLNYTFSGTPEPPSGTYKLEIVESEQNNYDVTTSNSFDWTTSTNFPPQVQSLPKVVLNPNQTYTATGSFTDSDSTNWTATVDYGDGSGVQSLPLNGMNFALSHVYTQAQFYTVKVNITDEHGNTGQSSTTVYVELDDLTVSNPRIGSDSFTIDLHVDAPDNVCSWWTSLHHAYIVDLNGNRLQDFAGCGYNGNHNWTISGTPPPANGTYKLEIWESEQPNMNGGSYDVFSPTFVWQNPNLPPTINSISNAAINEGDTYTANGSFTDAYSTLWTATVDYGDGSGTQSLPLSGTNFSLSHQYKDEGSYTITVSVINNQGATGTGTATITVNNGHPSVGTITGLTNPVQMNTATSVSASFTDPGVSDTHTASWNWGDGNTTTGTVTEANGSGTVGADNHTYTAAGVYTVTLTVTDDDGQSATSTYQYVSVYNPTSQGVFSAGSHFTSPTGAYTQNTNLTGTVKFGLSYKYQGTMPVGDKQFTMDLNTANFTFNATTVSSLVIANGIGTLRGTGTINGAGTYNFLVTGNESANTIRMQVKDTSGNTIYDTQQGASDTATPTTSVTGHVLAH